MVKTAELDELCRQQQVGEGWFPSLAEAPTHALTLTVPAIMRCDTVSVVAPDARKANAVKGCLLGPVQTACPGSQRGVRSQRVTKRCPKKIKKYPPSTQRTGSVVSIPTRRAEAMGMAIPSVVGRA